MSESEEESERLMELSEDNLLKCPQFTTPTRTVYFIVNCFCDESTGLGRSHVMFRGDDAVMETVLGVRLAMYDAEMDSLRFATLGLAKPDPENEDCRVLMFRSWKSDLPLPLGGLEVPNSHITRLALVIFHTEDWKESSLKFAADIVSQPPMFRDGSRLKRILRECGDAVLRICNGRVIELTGAQDALDMSGPLLDSFSAQSDKDILHVKPLSASSTSSSTSSTSNYPATHSTPHSTSHAPLWLSYARKEPEIRVRRIVAEDIREESGMDIE